MKKFPIKIPKTKIGDQPVTRALLKLSIKELKSEIMASERRLELKFVGLKSEFGQLRGEFAQLRGEFAELRAFIVAAVANIEVKINRSSILAEEQRNDNRIVLEGLAGIWERQQRHEVFTGFSVQ